MADGNQRAPDDRAHYVLGFELRPGHILQVDEASCLLSGQVLLIQAVALLRTNGATDVVVCLIDGDTGRCCERVAVAPRERLGA